MHALIPGIYVFDVGLISPWSGSAANVHLPFTFVLGYRFLPRMKCTSPSDARSCVY
jgi:hypothetical protein